ncbi:MAG: hypothetical protein AAB227_00065, partial [Pseudomonadota bacterium]
GRETAQTDVPAHKLRPQAQQAAAPDPVETPVSAAPRQPSAVAASLAKGAKAVGQGITAVGRATWKFLSLLANKEKRRTSGREFREGADRAMNGLVDRFNSLTAVSRVLMFLALSLVMVARGGVLVASWNRAKEERVAAYERSVAAVEQKIDSAEASMIYRDESRARELLAEATTAVAALPEKRPAELEVKESLRQKVSASYDTLRREVKLGQPEIVASITVGAEQPALSRLAPADGVVWSVSSKGEIFKVSIADGATEHVADVPGGAAPAIFLTQGKDIFAASGTGAAAIVTLAGKKTDRTVDFQGADAAVADAGVYNARLYVLDAAHNRIMRHQADDKGYGQAQFYLKDGTDLSQAVSMSIDGLVYVLRKDGSIVRIAKGLQESFSVSMADPTVTAPLRLRTGADADLFVLDSAPMRILRYNKKTGVLMAQYVSDSLKGASDFVIDAKGTTALVAVNNQILRFALPDTK